MVAYLLQNVQHTHEIPQCTALQYGHNDVSQGTLCTHNTLQGTEDHVGHRNALTEVEKDKEIKEREADEVFIAVVTDV